MAESKETSALFTLKSLLEAEEDRVRSEAEERRRREAAEAEAKEASRAAAREAERARLEAAERAAALARQQEEEERQRIEALRHAAIERARLEAEAAANVALLERQQEHERRLHALADVGFRRRARIVIVATNVAWAVLAGAGCIGYFEVVQPAANRQHAALNALAVAESERAEESVRLMRQSDAEVDSMRDEVAELRETVAKLRAAWPAPPTRKPGLGPHPTGFTRPVIERAVHQCDPNDPLDYDLCP
ncbi:MAG: hypothetical protein JW751_03945 [Polyangiaceae bacterium]|nr:hypothetical protein [Polyangiaceae bacterium]